MEGLWEAVQVVAKIAVRFIWAVIKAPFKFAWAVAKAALEYLVIPALHVVGIAACVILAIPFVIVYWAIWLLARRFDEPRLPAKFPNLGDATSQVQLETLLGPKPKGQIDAVFEGGGGEGGRPTWGRESH